MPVSSKVLVAGLMAGCAMTTVSVALAQSGAPLTAPGTLVAQVFSGGTVRDIRVEESSESRPLRSAPI